MHKKLSTALVSVVILSFFAVVIDASDNYTVDHGANLNITAHTVCNKVTNNSATSASIYVPTQTDPEWESFYTNPPAGVTIGSCSINVTVTAGANRNLCTLAGNPTTPGEYVFTINAGTIINSGSTGSAALTTGTCWRAGSKVTVVNNGRIYGRGGDGGDEGQSRSTPPGNPGAAGGHAVSLSYPVSIDNTNGYIFGGGGGGGGGRTGAQGKTGNSRGGGGGGGQGSVNSAGGCRVGDCGGAGTANAPGAGGQANSSGTGENGGSGGAWGQAGQRAPGSDAGAGGAAGKAIDTNGHAVTWIAGNNTTRVKGAVSN